MQYYIAQNGQPVGPFEPNQLLAQGLRPDSLVWNESMSEWTPAGQVGELASLFAQAQAPIPQQPAYQQPVQQPAYQQPAQQPAYQQPAQQPAYQQPVQQPAYQQPAQQPYAPAGMNGTPQMGFVEAVKTCLVTKYCNFSGRARRSEYWWFALAIMVLNSVLYACITPMIASSIGNASSVSDIFLSPGYIILSIVSLALILPHLGVTVRRLHDTNHSGWWLLMYLVPLVNLVFAIVMLIWLCKDSDRGTNKYGPSPKYP